MAKEFFYKGKKVSELKGMSIEEYAKLVPSRLRRSLNRGFTDAEKRLLVKIRRANKGDYKKQIKTHCRDMVIIPEMLDLTIHIHNGKTFVPIKIMPEMLGRFLGEFTANRSSIKHSAPGIGATRSSAAASVK
jgi:small subunit ribosomal protein S19